jgi:hypothetical protein
MIFAGLCFAGMARMRLSTMERRDSHYQFTLKTKKKEKRQLVRLWKLPDEFAAICLYRAIDRLLWIQSTYCSNPPDEIWTDPGPWPPRPDSARDISKNVSWCLGQAKLPTDYPYMVKKATVEFLQAAGASATQIAQFFRHFVSFMHERHYMTNDLGQQATLRICQHFRQTTSMMRVCICH